MQVYNSIMSGYFCKRYFMLTGKSLLDYTNLFSPNKNENNDKVILNYFQKLKRLRWKKSNQNSKNLKYHTFSKKLVLSVICSNSENEDEKIFKEEESTEVLNVLV